MKQFSLEWEYGLSEYNLIMSQQQAIKTFKKAQIKSKRGFSRTSLDVSHYLFPLKLISNQTIYEAVNYKARILDVGAFINMFSDFVYVNNKKIAAKGYSISSKGVEIDPLYCRISRDLFPNVEMIEGDIRELSSLTNDRFNIILFSQFFHQANLYSVSDILRIFEEVDKVLDEGGFILCEYANSEKKQPDILGIYSEEGDLCPAEEFLPAGYSFSNKPSFGRWYMIAKYK